MLLQRYSGPDGSISTEDEEAIRGSAGTLLVGNEVIHFFSLPKWLTDGGLAAEDTVSRRDVVPNSNLSRFLPCFLDVGRHQHTPPGHGPKS